MYNRDKEEVYSLFKIVKEDKLIHKVKELADIIWHEAYKEMIRKEQIDYMLDKFQSFEAVKRQINKEQYHYYLIYEGDIEIGFFAFTNSSFIFLSKVYLLNSFRGKGYFRKVIDFLLLYKKKITLTVNKGNLLALNAYSGLGFFNVSEVKTDIGGGFYMDDFIMEREFTFKDLINIEQEKPYFKSLLKKIEVESKTNVIYPKKEDIFKALKLTEFKDVKVVVIGQDPYFNKDQAMGLCFSVNENIKMPPSLVNIYKEIEKEYGKPMPKHGNLTGWAKQGVLLLNTILTVSEKKPMSHKGFGWETFTDEVISILQQKDFVVYLLLGAPAQSYEKKITNKNHAILKTSHPSPLSSYRGFLGSNVFKETNRLLKEKGKNEINWYLL